MYKTNDTVATIVKINTNFIWSQNLCCVKSHSKGSPFELEWFPIIKRWLWHLCVAADCVLGGRPGRVWRLCFPLWLRAGGSDFRLYDGSDLKTYLLMEWWGPDALAVCQPAGFTCWISFAPVFSFVCCWVLVFALSPCCVLVCVFWGMIHWWVWGLLCKPNNYVS